jgi:hypothetical protein
MSAVWAGAQQPPPGLPSLETAFRAFEEADRLLLSPQKMQPYGGNWVAAFNGDIIADPDLISLQNRLREKGISLGFVAIRFIEKDGQAAA